MKTPSNRAMRRHHRARIKRARQSYWGGYPKTPRHLGILCNTAALCSCSMCRNQRQEEGDTIQELRHISLMHDQVLELYEKEIDDEEDC